MSGELEQVVSGGGGGAVLVQDTGTEKLTSSTFTSAPSR